MQEYSNILGVAPTLAGFLTFVFTSSTTTIDGSEGERYTYTLLFISFSLFLMVTVLSMFGKHSAILFSNDPQMYNDDPFWEYLMYFIIISTLLALYSLGIGIMGIIWVNNVGNAKAEATILTAIIILSVIVFFVMVYKVYCRGRAAMIYNKYLKGRVVGFTSEEQGNEDDGY